jgi:hypothetical protein
MPNSEVRTVLRSIVAVFGRRIRKLVCSLPMSRYGAKCWRSCMKCGIKVRKATLPTGGRWLVPQRSLKLRVHGTTSTTDKYPSTIIVLKLLALTGYILKITTSVNT